MNVTFFSLFHSLICTNSAQRQLFDLQFQKYVASDEQGSFRLCIDFAVDNSLMNATIRGVLYGQLYTCTTVENDPEEEVLYSIAAALLASDVRGDVIQRQHINWRSHVRRLHKEGTFSCFYRMSYYSFQKLLAILQPTLMVNTWKSHVQTNTKLINAEIILHCTL
jgi:hypothetical protein